MRRALLAGLAAAVVPPVILAAGIWVTASRPFLAWEYGRPGFPTAAGFTSEERMAAAVPSTLYLTRPGITEADLAALRHSGQPLYEEGEIEHLIDVKRLVQAVGRLGAGSGLLLTLLLLFVWRRRSWRGPAGVGMSLGALAVFALIAVVGVLVAGAWDTFFVGFHEMFFAEGTWQFSAASNLIQLFPDRFWFDTAVFLATLSGLMAMLTAGVGWYMASRADVAPGRAR